MGVVLGGDGRVDINKLHCVCVTGGGGAGVPVNASTEGAYKEFVWRRQAAWVPLRSRQVTVYVRSLLRTGTIWGTYEPHLEMGGGGESKSCSVPVRITITKL